MPADGATGVSPNISQIKITWNEDMGPGFRLTPPEPMICTNPSYNASKKEFTFPCTGPINPLVVHEFLINPEVKSFPTDLFSDFFADAFGNIAAGISIFFTTGP